MIINEHTNSDGETYYSTLATDGMIYSSAEDFEATWDQATEDAAQARVAAYVEARAHVAARMAAAEAARMAAAEAEARAAAWTSEAEARAINPYLTAQEARMAAVAAFAEAAEAAEAKTADEFWIIDLDHPTEPLGEFPASGPYPSQAAAEKYIISDTKAIWEESCTCLTSDNTRSFCGPLKIVRVVRTVQPEVTAKVSLVDSH